MRYGTAVAALVLAASACRAAAGDGMPIREEEVRFANDSVLLAGTLVLPDTQGRFPAIVLIHGSGPETRRMYLRYAREFAKAGIAALAYDKRGAGKSTPVSPRATYEELARDALAGVTLLERDSRIDSTRIGLWGLSEGEWVAPLAASMMADPAFLILVSASSLTPTQQVGWEIRERLEGKGYPDSIVSLALSLHARIAEFQRNGTGRDSLNADLQRASGQPWFADADDLDARMPEYERVRQLPWFPAWRANMDFDALAILRELETPVLVLLGGKDPKNDATLALARYADALKRDSGRVFRGRIFPEAEHALVEWWLPFRLPPPRYPKGYFEEQTAWVRQQLSSSR